MIRPILIAGPCLAESKTLLQQVARTLVDLAEDFDCDFYFKASFDKANRTSINSSRGPGTERALGWLSEIKKEFGIKILTDVHETHQIEKAAQVCDGIQIPAFLCRQTDLLLEAVRTGKYVNIKKGQFVSPYAMQHIVDKALSACAHYNVSQNISVTERGTCFGYGDLVVDMRSLAIMENFSVPVIFDITHSTQKPSHSAENKISKATKEFAPLLARCAASSGYISGFFLEVHTIPEKAQSDADAQLTPEQAELLLKQSLPLLKHSLSLKNIDAYFTEKKNIGNTKLSDSSMSLT